MADSPAVPAAPAEEGPLYRSTLYQFQAEGLARSYFAPAKLAIWDLGTGKSHLAMATACLLFEDHKIDQVLVVCESGKMPEWVPDFQRFTRLSARAYHGTNRTKVLKAEPQVLVTTYETAARDTCELKPKTRGVIKHGPLLKYLLPRRTLVVYDETQKLRNRTSRSYKSHDTLLRQLRKAGNLKVLGLTGTPVETGPENFFNIARLIDPEHMPTTKRFHDDYVLAEDDYGRARDWKNISPDSMVEREVTPFTNLVAHLVMRKRKTDPDIVDQFPQKVEEAPHFIPLHQRHQDLLAAVAEEVSGEASDKQMKMLYGIMRQLVGHPASILRSRGDMARLVVAAVGEKGLRAIPSAKTEAMLDWAVGLGPNQGVIFTFYGQSILPELVTVLHRAGFSVAINHGGLGVRQKAEAQAMFKAGDRQIFLSSDAGARGLNLENASYLLHYEPTGIWAIHQQRSDRIHRISGTAGKLHELINIQMLVADTPGSPDRAALDYQLARQEVTELAVDYDVMDDPALMAMSAEARRKLIALVRRVA